MVQSLEKIQIYKDPDATQIYDTTSFLFFPETINSHQYVTHILAIY